VRSQEIRQSLRIIAQCLEQMPGGPYKSHQPLAVPPIKEPGTMHDIETLIDHFLAVELGPGDPAGRGLPGHRGDQGQQRLLPGERRHRERYRTASARRRSRICRSCP